VTWVGVTQAGYRLAPDGAAEAMLAKAHASARAAGAALGAYVMPAYLDAALYANHAGIPALVYGPISERIHAPDERVSLASLKRVTATIALFAAGWCG
jgi:acetylornithine deacetylase